MLYITFKESESVITNVDMFFDNNYEPEWLLDPFVKKIIHDIDKSDVLSENVISSPVFGSIPPRMLSGGTKALILMLKENKVIWATACGDNCAKWIIEISKLRDITICLEHAMKFSNDFDAICLDTNEEIHTLDDYKKNVLHGIWGV